MNCISKCHEMREYAEKNGREAACQKYGITRESLKRNIRGSKNAERKESAAQVDDNKSQILQRIAEKYSDKELKALADDSFRPQSKDAEYTFDGETVKIGVFSDPHIGSKYTNENRVKATLDAFSENNVSLALLAGDITEGMSGRDGHVYELKHIGYQEQRKAAIELFKGYTEKFEIKMISGNHDCLDEKTELLTRRGWVNYKEIDLKTDYVLSYNPKTNKSIWDKINDLIIKKSSGNIISIDFRGHSFRGTEGHRVICSKRIVNKYGKISYSGVDYIKAGELSGRIKIPCARMNENKGIDISDSFLRLCGRLLTDGGISKTGYRIYQSKPINKIEKILDELNLEYTVNIRDRDITHICGIKLKSKPLPQKTIKIKPNNNLKKLMPDKNIQDWMNDLNDSQFQIMLNSIIDGDGSRYRHTNNSCIVYGTEKFLSDLQGLCVSHGFRTSLTKDNRGAFRLNITVLQDIEFDSYKHIKRSKTIETVWCLSVPLTNFMVRRNGMAYFTGNCWYAAKANMGALIVKDICESIGAEYLGEHEATILINGAKVMLWHGEDGASYAISYRSQKIIEALQGGQKPHLLILGHDHKHINYMVRNVHVVGSGCIQDQTPWMRRKRLEAHCGFWILEVTIRDASIVKLTTTWYPFYV